MRLFTIQSPPFIAGVLLDTVSITEIGMAEEVATENHIFCLSSIDQSFVRGYVQYGLCFACKDIDIGTVMNRLTATVKRTVTHLPILAGTVRPTKFEDGGQQGRVEVEVNLEAVNSFMPVIARPSHDAFGYTYEDLAKARMPPSALVNDSLTPLPDVPDPQGSPVFAIQANFISSGLIVAIYLHHAVADIMGMRTITSHLSSDLPPCKLSNDDLRDDALEQSRLRDRLSGSRAAKPDLVANTHPAANAQSTEDALKGLMLDAQRATSHVLALNLNLIEATKDILNERFHYIHNDCSTLLSAFDIVAAILWKGVNRARFRVGKVCQEAEVEELSTVIVPVNIRKRIEPPLDDAYFGNATMHGLASAAIARLAMPFDASSMAHTARLIRAGTAAVSEERIRSAIAGINEASNVQAAPIKRVNFKTDLLITSWADLALEHAHLSLGLGKPEWGRKLGRGNTAYGCIVYPVRRDEGMWEVMVQLTEEVMESLLHDENFMSFVMHVA